MLWLFQLLGLYLAEMDVPQDPIYRILYFEYPQSLAFSIPPLSWEFWAFLFPLQLERPGHLDPLLHGLLNAVRHHCSLHLLVLQDL